MINFKDYPDIVKTFLEIIPINNPSGHEEELMLWLVDKLTEMGVVSISQDNFGNLIAKIKTNIENNNDYLMFIAHLDSVHPCMDISYKIEPHKNDFIIKPKSHTILSADDKVGVAAIVEAIKAIIKSNIPHPNLELIFTVQEEVGLLGAKAIDYSKIKSKCAYSVDGESPVGTIITQGPAQKLFNINFIGKASHAGINPEDGINSILIASDFINNITTGRIDHSTTTNIGLIQGGVANNITPELTKLTGEVRSLYESKLDGIIAAYRVEAQKTIEKYPGSSFELIEEFRYNSYFIHTNHPGVALAVKACQNIGLEPNITSIGSGSDANVFNFNNVPTIILGTGFQNTHSHDEFITFSQLTLLKDLIINLIKEAGTV